MQSHFPTRKIDDPFLFLSEYAALIAEGWKSLDADAVRTASKVLRQAYIEQRHVFVCGNGGSCAIADHFECDHAKGVHTGTTLSPRVRSLVANTALLTAVANDIGYDQVFVHPLQRQASPGDVLVAISSSGKSPNIVNAIKWAKAGGIHTIALTGFEGGPARDLADVSLHVGVHNYGVVEDIHQGIAHVLAQYIRHGEIAEDKLPSTLF